MNYNNENLKKKRTDAGLSQSDLAYLSEVNIRMIQYYEQGRNDINKAEAGTVYLLATALGCKVEDILQIERLTE